MVFPSDDDTRMHETAYARRIKNDANRDEKKHLDKLIEGDIQSIKLQYLAGKKNNIRTKTHIILSNLLLPSSIETAIVSEKEMALNGTSAEYALSILSIQTPGEVLYSYVIDKVRAEIDSRFIQIDEAQSSITTERATTHKYTLTLVLCVVQSNP